MKRSALIKELFREIWRSRNRFLSILAIIALGTGFFAGVKSTAPDMLESAWKYYDDSRLMDFRAVTTLGITQEDLDALAQVGDVMPGYSVTVMGHAEGDDAEKVVQVLDLGDGSMNVPELVEGRLPQAPGECVVENGANTPASFQVGATLVLSSGDEDSPLTDTLAHTELTVVGVVESPLYISMERGYTTLGSGKVNTFILVLPEEFVLDVYTDAYIRVPEAQGVDPFSDAYETLVREKTEELEAIGSQRAPLRLEEIREDAQAELDDARAELEEGRQTQAQELADARQELDEGWAELEQGRLDAQAELDDARAQLDDGWDAYNSGLADYEAGRKTMEDGIAQGEAQLEESHAQLTAQEAVYAENLEAYEAGQAAYDEAYPGTVAQLEAAQAQTDQGSAALAQAREQWTGVQTLAQGTAALMEAYRTAALPGEAASPAVVSQAAALDALLTQTGAEAVGFPELLEQYIRLDPAQAPQEKAALEQALETALAGVQAILDAQQTQLDAQTEALEAAQAEIDAGYAQLEETGATLQESKAALDAGREALDAGWAQYEAGVEALEAQRTQGETELADAKAVLDASLEELNQGEADYAQGKAEAEAELADAEAELEQGEADYAQGKADSDAELADAQREIDEGQADVDALEAPEWYIFDRDDNPGYSEFETNAMRVDAIAKVFPVFFIMVALLVSLTTMTRMVEENRTQIGTMKALGYGGGAIASKYILYAAMASVLGTVLGLTVGFYLFPTVIFNAYRIMYRMPGVMTPFRWDYAIGCGLTACLSTTVAALMACAGELRAVPATSMRPRAPKSGKRILLERAGGLWRRLGFMTKVTARNLFRYKKRLLMTVVGICGCTALMLTGYALREAITSIETLQFEEIFTYDLLGSLAEDADAQAVGELLEENPRVADSTLLLSRSLDVEANNQSQSVTLFVPQKVEEMDRYITLRERVGHAPLTLEDDGVIITEKLSRLLDLQVGDTVFLREELEGREAVVLGVTENYVNNYVYMTPALYASLWGEEPPYNTFAANMDSPDSREALASDLLEVEDIQGLSFSSDIASSFRDAMKSLDLIVLVIIVTAGALAFIVLYNLTNINVGERVRELATVKVLGFYDGETAAYIYRENIAATCMGIALGLVGGIFLSRFVIHTAELDTVMFAQTISLSSYLAAAALTLAFTLVVNVALYFRLKRLDMVESLKGVE